MIFDHIAYKDYVYVSLGLIAGSIFAALYQFIGHTQFQRLRYLHVVKKRLPHIVMVQARMVILFNLVVMPLTDASKIWIISTTIFDDASGVLENTSSYIKYQIAATAVMSTITPTFIYLIQHIGAMRLWLLYYQLKLLQSHQCLQWGEQITRQFRNQDFFLRNQLRWGNPRWLWKPVCAGWLVVSTLLAGFNFYIVHWDVYPGFEYAFRALQLTVFLLPLVFILFLRHRLPERINDNLLFEEDFRMTANVMILSTALYLSGLGMMVAKWQLTMRLTIGIANIFSSSAPSLVATVWVSRKVVRRRNINLDLGISMARGLVLDQGVFKDRLLRKDGTRALTLVQELVILFADREKMVAMANWMTRDYTLENFLCFVEMVQFKEMVIVIIQSRNEKFDEKLVIQQRHKFFEHCPQSSIVFGQLALGAARSSQRGSVVLEMATIHEDDDTKNGDAEQQDEEPEESIQLVFDETKEMETPHRETAPSDSIQSIREQPFTMVDILSGATSVGGSDPRGTSGNAEENNMVLEDEDVARFARSAHMLFERYLKNGTPWEINISGELRAAFYQLERTNYSTLTPMAWIELYDDVLCAVHEYITQSYARMIQVLRDRQRVREEAEMKKGR